MRVSQFYYKMWCYHIRFGGDSMSLTDDFVKEIERRILTGEWEIGKKIHPLRELADDFQVSRSVVNAGIVDLQNKGYLKTIPRKCTFVADWKKEGTFAVLNGIISNELYDKTFISSILEARMSVECSAVRAAAERRTDKDLIELAEAIHEEKRAITIDDRSIADARFHHTVATASHNIIYPIILKSFEETALKFITFFYQKNYDRAFVYNHHKTIYDAIRDRNSELAEATMRELLKQGEDILENF